MNWRTTGALFVLAAGLFVFIYFFERPSQSRRSAENLPARLIPIVPSEVVAIQLKRTNQLSLRVERTNSAWHLTVPLAYPAEPFRIEGFLKLLESAASQTFISLDELKASNRSLAEFGLEVPQATLTLIDPRQRVEVEFGSRTPPGDGVYMHLINSEGIHVVSAELCDRLPRTFQDWRDAALINLAGVAWDRMEVRTAGRGFAIQTDRTNRVFYLSKPTPARVDAAKLDALLRRILPARVERFENDNPRADLEPYSLQAPEAELVFGLGTNDVVVVQFGKSPTNDSSLVYARRLSNTNIVLVPRAVLDALQTSHSELRDLRLLSFQPSQVDEIEAVTPERFAVQGQTSGSWILAGLQPIPADASLVREWIERLAHLEGNVEKDVVTDFASYGLATPTRQYVLKTGVTNALGILISNRVIAHLDVGGRQGGEFFARSRGADENTVHSVPAAEIDRLPTTAWQVRDRRVWSFTTNQVTRATIRQHGYTRQFNRSPAGEWTLASGSQGVINTFGIEESVYRLGQLRAAVWVDRGEDKREHYGITDLSHKITLELKDGDKPRVISVEFGSAAPSRYPYAITIVDGQPTVFEFPWDLYNYLQPYLTNPPRAPNP
jgi:hypothetical protein